jgi:hypothetical protein
MGVQEWRGNDDLSSGCGATRAIFYGWSAHSCFTVLADPLSRPYFHAPLLHPLRNAWQTNSYLITECMDGEAVSDLILNPHDL